MVRMKWNEMTWRFHMFGPFVIGFSALHSEHWYPYQSKFCLEKHPFWNAERTFEPNFPLQSWNCFAVRKSFFGRPKEVSENIQSRSPDQILWNLKTFTHKNQEKHVKKIMNSWIQTSPIFSRKQVSAPVWNINIMNHKLPWRPTADLKCLKFWLTC